MKYSLFIPLIGGFGYAAQNVFNQKPEYILGYKEFDYNDKAYVNHNNLEEKYFQLNVEDDYKRWLQIPKVDIDFILAIPPCAGLSTASKIAVRKDDWNDYLFKVTEFTLDKIKPKFLIAENAKQLWNSISYQEKLNKIVLEYGYKINYVRLSGHFFGTPQIRHRTFFIVSKQNFEVKIEDDLNVANGYNFFGNLSFRKDDPMYNAEKQTEKYNNHYLVEFWKSIYGIDYRKKLKEQINKIAPRKTSLGLITALKYVNYEKDTPTTFRKNLKLFKEYFNSKINDENRKKIEHIINLTEDRVERWIKQGNIYTDTPVLSVENNYLFPALIGRYFCSGLIHPIKERFLTLREAADCMGLPRSFVLPDLSKNNILFQNIPRTTGEWIIKECVRFTEGKRKNINTNIIKQDFLTHKDILDMNNKPIQVNNLNNFLE